MIIQTPIAQLIINWFHFYGRKELPWKKTNKIYKIWISEIMLQRTKVSTVIPFYNKFIKKFPSFKKLEKSNLNQILYYWSGLGYYSRAHNIYKSVKIIKKKHSGKLPNTIKDLIKLPGIGKTTAGAILSFSINSFVSILDSNIERVLKRFYYIKNINTNNNYKKYLWKVIEKITPIQQTNKFNQGIMDIGSLICTPINPKCIICPLKNFCISYKKKIIYIKKSNNYKKNIVLKKYFMIILQNKNYVFLEKRKKNKIWNQLFCFPSFLSIKNIKKWLIEKKIQIKKIKKLKKIIHKLSNFNMLIIPIIVLCKKKNIYNLNKLSNNYIWFNLLKNDKIAVPSPIKKILLNINKYIREK
ncbi:A/G-specific adenine glycosylase [Buchnera aphidicola (Kurisakia onigurumii)]|uniref:A/G-specific adenine glycosylase n=1 Tax=Buchnera aphidicola TaxID=9 RepID=UPI0031B7356C